MRNQDFNFQIDFLGGHCELDSCWDDVVGHKIIVNYLLKSQ